MCIVYLEKIGPFAQHVAQHLVIVMGSTINNQHNWGHTYMTIQLKRNLHFDNNKKFK